MTGGCSCPSAPRGEARAVAAAMKIAIRRLTSSTRRLTANVLPKAPRCRLDISPRSETERSYKPAARASGAAAKDGSAFPTKWARCGRSRSLTTHCCPSELRSHSSAASRARNIGVASLGHSFPRMGTTMRHSRPIWATYAGECRGSTRSRRWNCSTAPAPPEDLTSKQLHLCRRARKDMVTQWLIACRKVLPPTKAAGLVDHSDGARSSSARASPKASMKPLRTMAKRASS